MNTSRIHEEHILEYTPTQANFELEIGQSEMDMWGQEGDAFGSAQYALHLFTSPPTCNPNPNAPDGFDPHHQAIMSQHQQVFQPQNNQHYHATPSSSGSPPPPSYSNHAQHSYQQDSTSPSSHSSNELHMTKEEADLKRLRNTAASARFRAKKKRYEQSLERSSREKREKLQDLENRIRDLEVENQWLKDLVMEKIDARTDVERAKARLERDVTVGDRKGYVRKDGVGT